jgi:serine protease AprX
VFNPFSSGSCRKCLFAIVVAVSFGAATTPALAQHRARLSADLADHMAVGSQAIDVIVHGDQLEVEALAKSVNVPVKRFLRRGGAVLRLNAGQLSALQADPAVEHLSSDARIHSVDVTALSIGADQAWAGANELRRLSGRGVGVAVIDSGIDSTHNALKGRVIVTKDFTGGNGVDSYGHGTHVAGIIVGAQGSTADTAGYQGIASGAYIINLRVLGADGSGKASDVVEAIDWAIDHRSDYNIRVINMSLGGPVLQPYRDDPMCEAVERAARAGIVVVAAAGNFGKAADGRRIIGGITSPGNSPHATTVGAIDTHGTPQRSDDTVADYSSRGPTIYDRLLKPDMVAPGSHIVSAEVTGSYLSQTFPARHVAGSGHDAYIQLSGTSMAAGVVSGAVALLLQERPGLRPEGTRAVLQLTSSFMPEAGMIAAGAGSINVLAAAELLKTGVLSQTTIAGERTTDGGVVFVAKGHKTQVQQITWSNQVIRDQTMNRGPKQHRELQSQGHELQSSTIYWGTSASDTIYWGTGAIDTIYWGTAATDTIYWGTAATDTIYWGTAATDTIYWGTAATDTIYWGTAATDTIYWGTAATDTIYWGTAATDTIYWGTAATATDTIYWHGCLSGSQLTRLQTERNSHETPHYLGLIVFTDQADTN